MRSWTRLGLWPLLMLAATTAAHADMLYTATLLPPIGDGSSFAEGINDAGQVVGYSHSASGVDRATLWSGGVGSDLGTLGGPSSRAYAINNSGQITGQADALVQIGNNVVQFTHAALWSGGTVTDLGKGLDPTQVTFFAGYGINASGQVVGQGGIPAGHGLSAAMEWSGGKAGFLSVDQIANATGINAAGVAVGIDGPGFGNPSHATVWSGGSTKSLAALGGGSVSGNARAINDAGQVVGGSQVAVNGPSHATLWAPSGTPTDLGTLGGSESMANGINAAGAVVGYAYIAGDADSRATLWSDGGILDLAAFLGPGWSQTIATGINDLGQIVGYGDYQGVEKGFLLTPDDVTASVAEPSTLLVLGSGLLFLGGWRLPRRPTA